MSKHHEMQGIIRWYKDRTGKIEVTMPDVVAFAVRNGYPLPAPIDPLERLAREFARAAREEIRKDTRTGQPYRVNHAYTTKQGSDQITFWIDIDEAPRGPMHKCLVQRREQMVGDALQLTLDADHWNSINLHEEPIQMPLDFAPDVDWRKHGPDEEAS